MAEIEHIRQVTAEVLQDPVYLPVEESFQTRIMKVLTQWYHDYNEWMTELSPIEHAIVFSVLVGLLVLIIWHMMYTVKQAFRVEAQLAGPSAGRRTLLSEVQESRQRAVQAGDWTQAIRDAFLELVLVMDKKETIHYSPSSTNRELVAGFEGLLADDLKQLTNQVDAYWYARKPADESDYERVSGQCKRIQL